MIFLFKMPASHTIRDLDQRFPNTKMGIFLNTSSLAQMRNVLNKINNDRESGYSSLGLEIIDIDSAVPLSSPDFKESHRAVLSFDFPFNSTHDHRAIRNLIDKRIILLQEIYDDYKPNKKSKSLCEYFVLNKRKGRGRKDGRKVSQDCSIWLADEHTMCYVPLRSGKGLKAFKLHMNRLIQFGYINPRYPSADKLNKAIGNLIECKFNILSVDDERYPDVKAMLSFDLNEILESVTTSDNEEAIRQVRIFVLSLLEDFTALTSATRELEWLVNSITSNIFNDDDGLPAVRFKCCCDGANDE